MIIPIKPDSFSPPASQSTIPRTRNGGPGPAQRQTDCVGRAQARTTRLDQATLRLADSLQPIAGQDPPYGLRTALVGRVLTRLTGYVSAAATRILRISRFSSCNLKTDAIKYAYIEIDSSPSSSQLSAQTSTKNSKKCFPGK